MTLLKRLKIIFKKTIIPILILALAYVGHINDVLDLYKNHLEQTRAEDNLSLLNTGVSIQHIKEVFGSPIVENHDDEAKLNEYIYSFKNFYLQIIYNKANTVIFYSVTSKNADFRPIIPVVDERLGETFMKISDVSSENSGNLSAKFFSYHEKIYLGYPGNYRNYYLAYNPSGIDYNNSIESISSEDIFKISESFKKPLKDDLLKRFRTIAIPNTYGVGGINNEEEKALAKHFEIGIDYYISNDIPEINQ